MFADYLTRIATAQAVNTASSLSGSSVDLGTARDIGEGERLFMLFTVTQTFDTLTSLTFNICIDTDAALATSNTVLATTGAITLASGGLAAGKQYALPIPPQVASLGKRYLGASFTLAGSTGGAGKVTVDIVKDLQDGRKFYTSGFSVT